MKRIAFLILAAVFVVGTLKVCHQYILPVRELIKNQNAGEFKRNHFEDVVEQVRLMTPNETEEIYLRLDDLSDPKTVRNATRSEMYIRGGGAGNIWATKSRSGVLKVVIQTKDLGHAGEYGFAYSDVPLTLQPFGEHWFTLDLPGRINIVDPKMKIDEHWWEVLYNLG